jgi:hypothetical protein
MFVQQLNINQIKEILTKILNIGKDISDIEIRPCEDYLHIEFDNDYGNGEIVREEINLYDYNSDWIGGTYEDTTVKYRKYMMKLFGQPYKNDSGMFSLM